MAYKFQVGTAIMSGAVQVIDDFDISGSGDVTLSGDLKLNGSAFGLTSAGVATIKSMGGNWTNASRTVADMGTVTTMDLNGGSIDGTVIGAASAADVTATDLIIANSGIVYLNGDGGTAKISCNSGNNVNINAPGDVVFNPGGLNLLPENNNTIELGDPAKLWKTVYATSLSSSTSLSTAGNLKVGNGGAYGLTSAGVATIASMGGNWTNASRTVADMGTVTTMDLNGGSIDGTAIGAASATTAKFTTVSASSTLDVAGNVTMGGTLTLGQGDFYVAGDGEITASALNINDTCRIHANGKLSSSTEGAFLNLKVGAAGAYGLAAAGGLTIASMAANWTNASRTVADMGTVTTIDINGGSIDGTAIGAASQSTAKFTTVSASSTLQVAGASTLGGKLTVNGAAVIEGDLEVHGTTTMISSSHLLIQDRLIGMGFSGSTAGSVSDRAIIMGLNGENSVAVMWDESADQFAFVRTATRPDSTAGVVTIAEYADLRVKSIVGGQAVSVTAFTAAGALADGYNYASSLNAAATMTLPSSPTAGDVIYVKGNGNTSVAKAITVSGSTGSKATFDGGNPIQIVSPYGAVNLICLDASSGAEKWSVY